ncbi:hypothetical protein BH20ACT22_BH20ACT22_04670 [soil metagenome]
MSWINAGEVFYVVYRASGRSAAVDTVTDLRSRVTFDLASPARVLEAAAIKAVYPMAYADAFAIATAQAHDALLLTGDPEILAAAGGWAIEDVR